MTGHQINSLVGDLVAMAQAMERLPQVEAELHAKGNEVVDWQRRYDIIAQDLEQSRGYAASLEAKVHNAEVARDDAELRFLELDERASKAATVFDSIASMAMGAFDTLTPPKPQPESQPEPMPIAIAPSGYEHDPIPSLEGTPMPQPLQGQSEPGPITMTDASSGVTEASVNSSVTIQDATSGNTEPKPSGPYSGHRYIDYSGYIRRDDWLAGGGTEEDYRY